MRYLGSDVGENGWAEGMEMKDWCNQLSFDMIDDLIFGKNFGCVERGEHWSAVNVMFVSTDSSMW